MKRAILVVLFFCGVLFISGCADTVSFSKAASMEPVGFWYGLWHGMIAPIAWVFSLFDDSVSIYAIYNNGGWYDFGFISGIGGAAGGGIRSSSK